MTCGGCTILLVEDEFLIALDVQMRLQEAGYNVLDPVASVEEAMSVLDKTPVCVAKPIDYTRLIGELRELCGF